MFHVTVYVVGFRLPHGGFGRADFVLPIFFLVVFRRWVFPLPVAASLGSKSLLRVMSLFGRSFVSLYAARDGVTVE